MQENGFSLRASREEYDFDFTQWNPFWSAEGDPLPGQENCGQEDPAGGYQGMRKAPQEMGLFWNTCQVQEEACVSS